MNLPGEDWRTLKCIKCGGVWRTSGSGEPLLCVHCRSMKWHANYKTLAEMEREWADKARAEQREDVFII